ncbi:glycosyltransferase family 2 protein [Natronoflexus pectinivorans]|uniref:Uncharacterized protein n=1 Tax=Natronoflexus pectinivorans TaxID=682526 RepID=A0A4R2GFS4_9BACT|nr:glycosyltransferase family 2 protein [Natronoflexus pectinivorans]TCO06893.1 hypothetical protein EV194_1119 [Natronoflexus pectinivorans]
MTICKKPLLVTILVHYNAPDECVSIVNQLAKTEYSNHEIVVVDNPSTPEVFEILKQQLTDDKIHVIQNHSNSGYGAGINFGAEYAKKLGAKYYHIINTDTSIVNGNYISKIIEEFDSTCDAGLIGPGVITPSGDVQNTIMQHTSIKNAKNFKKNQNFKSITEAYPKLYPVEVINGVCFIVKAEAFKFIKGFDEDFFMYGEEHDFCERLHTAGYQVYYWSGCAIKHFHQQSNCFLFTWRDALARINQILYLQKRNRAKAIVLALLFSVATTFKRLNNKYQFEIPYKSVIKGYLNPVKFNKQLKDKH